MQPDRLHHGTLHLLISSSARDGIRSPPMAPTPPPICVNRAPVLTLLATVVAERLGYPPETALTRGRFLAGSSASANGRVETSCCQRPSISPTTKCPNRTAAPAPPLRRPASEGRPERRINVESLIAVPSRAMATAITITASVPSLATSQVSLTTSEYRRGLHIGRKGKRCVSRAPMVTCAAPAGPTIRRPRRGPKPCRAAPFMPTPIIPRRAAADPARRECRRPAG